MDPSSMAGKVKLGPPPSSTAGKVKIGPPPSSWADKVKLGTPRSSTDGKFKLGPTPSPSGRIFRASSSWHAKFVEVIDLISFDEDNGDVLPPPPSFRYEVGSDDEDSDDAPPSPPSSPESGKRKAPVTDYSNKKV
jgi:hypothetical protein